MLNNISIHRSNYHSAWQPLTGYLYEAAIVSWQSSDEVNLTLSGLLQQLLELIDSFCHLRRLLLGLLSCHLTFKNNAKSAAAHERFTRDMLTGQKLPIPYNRIQLQLKIWLIDCQNDRELLSAASIAVTQLSLMLLVKAYCIIALAIWKSLSGNCKGQDSLYF